MAQRRLRPVTNTALAEIVERTGLSMAALADHINDVAEENGVRLSYNGSAISHWLNGTMPRRDAVPLVVEGLARAVGQPELTPQELGWPAAVRQVSLNPWTGDVITCLTQLAREDMFNPRAAVAAHVYSIEALSPPERPARTGLSTTRTGLVAEPCDIGHIDMMTRMLHLATAARGGDHGRSPLSAYFLHHVLPHLRTTTGPTRLKLLRAAGELVCLLGCLSMDATAEGRAQRYFILASRLADEAEAPITRSLVLTWMLRQASVLGHQNTQTLVKAAADGIRRGCHPRVRAQVYTARAYMLALQGEGAEALADLRAVERDMMRTGSGELSWLEDCPFEIFSHSGSVILRRLGDLRGAESYLVNGLAAPQSSRPFFRAVVTASLAQVQVLQGRLDDAADTLLLLLAESDMVASPFLRNEVTAARNLLRAKGGGPAIHDGGR